MDDLDGTWDDVTGAITITAGNRCCFENFLNTMLCTNDVDLPFYYDGTGNAAAMTVPTGLTKAKFVAQFENYTILANVEVDGTRHGSRFYWSTIKTIDTWDAADFIEVEKDDGQQITGCKVLGDSLIIFKERKIFKFVFTGDRDVPFIRVRTASSVGCVAPYSIQEVDNGLVSLSYDGIYYFDGNNSYKVSDRLNTTTDLNSTTLVNASSLTYKVDSQYWLSVPSSASTNNDTMIVWDYSNNAMAKWNGMSAKSMATFWVDNVDERPYFGDYSGFVYRGATGVDDYPLGVQTAINSYYYTNWRHEDTLSEDKATAHVNIFFQLSNSVLTFVYSYDFEDTDQYSGTFSMASGGALYGIDMYGTGVYGGSGGGYVRRDLTGRGRVVRYGFKNNSIGESFQIDGIGLVVQLETDS
jgi:hypothetical protein